MDKYLRINLSADHICLTQTNVYFKLKEISLDAKAQEDFEVFISEEHFPMLLKIIQTGKKLTELLDFEAFGGNFADAIIKTQEKLYLISDDDTLLEKYTSWIVWPSKKQELTQIWQEDADLQSTFTSADDFISDQSEEVLWELYDMWEISHGKKVDLMKFSLQDFCSGGWALDGSYIDEKHRFVGFTNIAKVEIELFDGSRNITLTENELRKLLLSKYKDGAEAIGDLEPKAIADRGLYEDDYQTSWLANKKVRFKKIGTLAAVLLVYLVWQMLR